MKQPKLMSADAFSVLEVCQNALAAGALPRTPLQNLTYSEQCHARSLKYCSAGALALCLAEIFCKQQDHGLLNLMFILCLQCARYSAKLTCLILC